MAARADGHRRADPGAKSARGLRHVRGPRGANARASLEKSHFCHARRGRTRRVQFGLSRWSEQGVCPKVEENMKKAVSIDGKLVKDEDAKVSVLDHGLLYGDGLFEGIRVRAGRVFRLDQHLGRLAIGARTIGLELPFSSSEQAAIVTATVRAFGQKEA